MMTGKVGKRRARRCCRCAARTTSRARPTWARCPDTYTAYRRVDDEEAAQLFEEAWGVPLSRKVGYKIPEMFDAAVAGELKAMYIFGEDVAQTDPDTAHVIKALESARVPRLPGHLRERDDQVRRRDPAGLGVPREGRDVHQRRAALPARRGGDRPARRRQDRLRDHHHGLARARPRDGLGDAVGRAGRDRAADPDVRRRQLRADRPHGPAVAGAPPTAPTPRSSTTSPSTTPAARASSPRCPTRRPATRPTTSSRWCSSPAGVLQHYNAGTMTRRTAQPRPGRPRLAGDPPRRRRAAVDLRRRQGLGPQPRRARPSSTRRSPTASSRATCSRPSTSPRRAPTC